MPSNHIRPKKFCAGAKEGFPLPYIGAGSE
jgi:hypothetical protein